jgi:hypothetical protein
MPVPCAASGRNGSGGAFRTTIQVVSSLRPLACELALERTELTRPVEWQEHEAREQLGPDRPRLEFEAGDDAEVAAAAAQRPEEVGVLVRRRAQPRTRCGDDLGRDQIVDGQPVRPRQPAEAAAEGQAGDAGSGVDSRRHRQAIGGGRRIEIGERSARLNVDPAHLRRDADAVHAREVDHQAAVGHGAAGDVVAAALDRHERAGLPREAHRRRDVLRVGAPRDQRRALVYHCIPHGAGGVEAVVAGTQHGASHRRAQGRDRFGRDQVRPTVEGVEVKIEHVVCPWWAPFSSGARGMAAAR